MATRPVDPLDKAISDVLRDEMKARDIVASRIAERMGMAMPTFWGYHNGHRRMSAADFIAMCDAIGVPVEKVAHEAKNRVAKPSTDPTMFWH